MINGGDRSVSVNRIPMRDWNDWERDLQSRTLKVNRIPMRDWNEEVQDFTEPKTES